MLFVYLHKIRFANCKVYTTYDLRSEPGLHRFQQTMCNLSSVANLYCSPLISASVTLVLIIVCIFVDARDGYVLNMSAKERAQIEKEKLG